jgi:hypothetical protein
LRDDERGRLWALLAFTAAAFSHALVIVMPALLITYELVVRRKRWMEALCRTWLFFVPAAFAAMMRIVGHAGRGQLVSPFRNVIEGVLTMIAVAGQYLTSIFYPVGLSNHYTVTVVTSILNSGVLITIVWGLAWLLVMKRDLRWSLFAAIWFIIALAPVSQFVPHPTLRADRYLYIAVLGLFVLLAKLIASKRFLAIVAILILFVLTWFRIPDWHDAKTLWSDCLAKNPRDVVALYSLSGCAVLANDLPVAERFLREAIRIKPDVPEFHERLGGVLAAQGKRAEARQELTKALTLNTNLAEAHRTLHHHSMNER